MRSILIALVIFWTVVTALVVNTVDREPYQSGPFSGAITQILSPEEDDPGFNCHVHGNRVCGLNHDH